MKREAINNVRYSLLHCARTTIKCLGAAGIVATISVVVVRCVGCRDHNGRGLGVEKRERKDKEKRCHSRLGTRTILYYICRYILL